MLGMKMIINCDDNNGSSHTPFLDAQASLAPTHVCLLVRWSVGHTFEFPLPLNISVQQSSLMSISYFIKIEDVCVCVCVCACVRALVRACVFRKCVF